MSPRQLTDEEYNFLQGRRQVADFVESIYNDPTLTKEAKRLIKKKYPQIQIPDLDIEDRVDARFNDEKKRRDDEEAATRARREQEDWQSQRSTTQKKYGLTEEGMTDLEKFMVEKNIGDYDVAATYKVQKDPKPSEATFDSYKWNHEKAPGFAEIAKDPEGWGRSEILKAIRTDQERARGQG